MVDAVEKVCPVCGVLRVEKRSERNRAMFSL